MHLLGKEYRSWIEEANGDETCLLQGPYEFDNQLTFIFREPVVMASDARAWMECTWDNSADSPDQFFDPPQDVPYGEGSNQEMCFLLAYVAVR